MTNKAYSIHIGVNRWDSQSYNGKYGILPSCESDALAMFGIAEKMNFEDSFLLLTSEATKNHFRQKLSKINDEVNPGDLIFISFSGHGGQVKDKNGDEKDNLDETWCFYDGEMLDDEINDLLVALKEGINVLIISDSCFSGSIVRSDDMFSGTKKIVKIKGLKASLILIASSKEREFSRGTKTQGVFTSKLIEVWDDGAFQGDYQELYKAIFSLMPEGRNQNPTMIISDPVDCEFLRSPVFTLPKAVAKVY